jgi:putative ABC transport system substrate-binding protein
VLWDSFAADQVSVAVEAARTLRLQAQPIELRSLPYDYEGALQMAKRGRAQALLVMPSAVIFRDRVRFAGLAVQSRFPTMFPFREIVEAGGLMSYGVNLTALFPSPPSTWTEFSKAQSPPTSPSNSRRSSSWSSTSRPQRLSA